MKLHDTEIERLVEQHTSAIASSATRGLCDLAFGMAVGCIATLRWGGAIDQARNAALHRQFERAYQARRRELMDGALA